MTALQELHLLLHNHLRELSYTNQWLSQYLGEHQFLPHNTNPRYIQACISVKYYLRKH
jgi:hypothetical protein